METEQLYVQENVLILSMHCQYSNNTDPKLYKNAEFLVKQQQKSITHRLKLQKSRGQLCNLVTRYEKIVIQIMDSDSPKFIQTFGLIIQLLTKLWECIPNIAHHQ